MQFKVGNIIKRINSSVPYLINSIDSVNDTLTIQNIRDGISDTIGIFELVEYELYNTTSVDTTVSCCNQPARWVENGHNLNYWYCDVCKNEVIPSKSTTEVPNMEITPGQLISVTSSPFCPTIFTKGGLRKLTPTKVQTPDFKSLTDDPVAYYSPSIWNEDEYNNTYDDYEEWLLGKDDEGQNE